MVFATFWYEGNLALSGEECRRNVLVAGVDVDSCSPMLFIVSSESFRNLSPASN
jgi:hypothetical protein